MNGNRPGPHSEGSRGQLTMTEALVFLFVALLSAIAAGILL